jgi:hypothetical protein
LVTQESASRCARGYYLAIASVTLMAMMSAGYWGGEMILGK